MNKTTLLLIIGALLSLLITSCGHSSTTAAPATSIDSSTRTYSAPHSAPNTIVTTTMSPLPTRTNYSPARSVAVPSTTMVPNEPPESSYSSPVPTSPIPATTSSNLFLVARVIDGDTIEVLVNGQIQTVRYIGIDAPETKDPTWMVEPYGKEAYEKNRVMVEGKYVRLEKDVSETDKFSRLLRYVFVNDVLVNAELIKMGYATAYSYPPDTKYQSLFIQLEKEARDNKHGLWGLTTSTTTKSTTSTINSTSSPTTKSLTLAIESVTSPVKPGDSARLVARTLAGALCEIAVYYQSGKSRAGGLSPKTADAGGSVAWNWTVGSSTSEGSWRIEVTASLNGASVKQTTYFTVQ
jgi:micrococcal nuclease